MHRGQHFLEVTRPAIIPLVQDKAFQVDVIFFSDLSATAT